MNYIFQAIPSKEPDCFEIHIDSAVPNQNGAGEHACRHVQVLEKFFGNSATIDGAAAAAAGAAGGR